MIDAVSLKIEGKKSEECRAYDKLLKFKALEIIMSIILKISEHTQCIASSLQSFLKLLDFPPFSSSRKCWSCAGTASNHFTPLL